MAPLPCGMLLVALPPEIIISIVFLHHFLGNRFSSSLSWQVSLVGPDADDKDGALAAWLYLLSRVGNWISSVQDRDFMRIMFIQMTSSAVAIQNADELPPPAVWRGCRNPP